MTHICNRWPQYRASKANRIHRYLARRLEAKLRHLIGSRVPIIGTGAWEEFAAQIKRDIGSVLLEVETGPGTGVFVPHPVPELSNDPHP